MNKMFSILLLTLATTSVFAVPNVTVTVPEPEALALLAIGGVAMLLSRRKK